MPRFSLEGTFGLVMEIAVAILERLHVKDPWVIWPLFFLGLGLITDAVIRSEWASKTENKSRLTRRRIYGMLPVVLVFSVFAWFIYVRTSRPEPSTKQQPTTTASREPITTLPAMEQPATTPLKEQPAAKEKAATSPTTKRQPAKAASQAPAIKPASPAVAQPESANTAPSAVHSRPPATQFTQNIGGSGNVGMQAETINIGSVGRILSDDKYKGLVADLTALPRGTAAMVVFTPITDEMDHLAGQLQHAFGEANWQLPAYPQDPSRVRSALFLSPGPEGSKTNVPDGLHCVGKGEVADKVIRALETAGVKCERSSGLLYPPPHPEPTVTLFLGRDTSR